MFFHFILTFFRFQYISNMPRKKLEDKEKKKNLTITLDSEIYDALEDYIKDNETKRSRLIETLLKEYIDKNKNIKP